MDVFVCGWNLTKEDYSNVGVDLNGLYVYSYIGKTAEEIYAEINKVIIDNQPEKIIAHSLGCHIVSGKDTVKPMLLIAPVSLIVISNFKIVFKVLSKLIPNWGYMIIGRLLGIKVTKKFKDTFKCNRRLQLKQLYDIATEHSYFECNHITVKMKKDILPYGNHNIMIEIDGKHVPDGNTYNDIVNRFKG